MGLKCGIVGLPNVGKSSLFNLFANAQIARSENFPFCTIDPNVAEVPVKDERVDQLSKISKSKRCVYSSVRFVDIAGLVEGASDGAGLGNQFLSHISEVDVILLVTRCFYDEDIIHVMDSIDPIRDISIIKTELMSYDSKRIEKLKLPANEKQKLQEMLLAGEKLPKLQWDVLSEKPIILLCNGKEEALVDAVKEYGKQFNHEVYAISVRDIQETGDRTELDDLIKVCYKKLGLISYFTTGVEESRSWSIVAGTNAVNAAGEIHNDFIKHFIKAEVKPFKQYVESNGKCPARLEGKEYVMQDGDVVLFKIGR